MSNINIYSNWRSNNINKSSSINNYNGKMSSNRSFIGIIIGSTIATSTSVVVDASASAS